jgi:Family of unknown function (DUF6496)
MPVKLVVNRKARSADKDREGRALPVTSRKQAIAIGLAEARKAGDKVPPKSS